MSAPVRYAFHVADEKIWFSPNSVRDVKIPPAPHPTHLDNPLPFVHGRALHQILQPAHWSSAYGWISYIPLSPFYVQPFDRLWTVPALQYDKETKLWSLPRDTVGSWDRLSNNLEFLAGRILASYSIRAVAPYPPKSWGYSRSFKSYSKAQVVVHNACDWFFVWAGLFAYLLSSIEVLVPVPRDKESPLPQQWRDFLIREDFAGWIPGLEAAVSKHLPRIGVVFESGGSTPHFMERDGFPVSPLVMCGRDCVPLWYEWSPTLVEYVRKRQREGTVDVLRPYLPPADIWESALQSAFHDSFRRTPLLVPVSYRDQFSKRMLDCRQDFIQKQLAAILDEDLKLRAQENAGQRARRLARERYPPQTKVSVFLWEVDPVDSTRYRCRYVVRKGDRCRVLNGHTEQQKRYFSSLNAWHCCGELYPTGVGDNDGDEWSENEDMLNMDESDATHTPLPIKEVLYPEASARPDRFGDEDDEDASFDADCDALTSMILRDMRECFGFIRPVPLPDLEPLNLTVEEGGKFMRILGINYDRPGVKGFLCSAEARVVYRFYKLFGFEVMDKTYASDEFDLNEGCPSMLLHCDLLPRLRLLTLSDGRPLYYFDVPGPYTVAVYSPVVALSLCRNGSADPRDMVAYLLDIGARFHTLRDGPLDIREPLDPPHLIESLPRRPNQYRYSAEDYSGFLTLAREMFQNPRMRAAIQRGGYLWRLFHQWMPSEDVVQGPSSAACVQGACDGRQWYDDALTPFELDALVGTYVVERGNEDVKFSWWPPAFAFEDLGAGACFEFWVCYSEKWFLDRERAILNGEAQPIAHNQWRHQLRGLAPNRRWKQTLHDRSSEFIRCAASC